MSCCGKQRNALQLAPSQHQGASQWSSGPVDFEYVGHGQLTVTGPLTGTIYRFFAPGTRLRVHGSDAPSLVSVPNLKLVR